MHQDAPKWISIFKNFPGVIPPDPLLRVQGEGQGVTWLDDLLTCKWPGYFTALAPPLQQTSVCHLTGRAAGWREDCSLAGCSPWGEHVVSRSAVLVTLRTHTAYGKGPLGTNGRMGSRTSKNTAYDRENLSQTYTAVTEMRACVEQYEQEGNSCLPFLLYTCSLLLL